VDSRYAEPHNNLGNALRARGRSQEAEEHYAKALRLRPEYLEAQHSLLTSLALDLAQDVNDSMKYPQLITALRVPDRWEQDCLNLGTDRLVSIAAMPNVHLAVLPLAGLKPDFPLSAFCVFDDRLVTVETFHAEVSSRDPKDIEIYLEIFQKFSESALHGEEAMRFLRSRAQRLRGLG
jgi:tetratricopeptide (TPR) repeat protein